MTDDPELIEARRRAEPYLREVVDPQIAALRTGIELGIARGDVRILASHLRWMAERVHQAHHTGGPWQDCELGVCGSMEHMLAQVGLGKDLQQVERRP